MHQFVFFIFFSLTISNRSNTFTVKVYPQVPSFLWLVTVCRSEVLPALEEAQVKNHLSKMSINKSMGPDKMNPRVLRGLFDTVVSILLIIFKSL